MLIYVRLKDQAAIKSQPEYVLLEFQGIIENDSEIYDNQVLGDMNEISNEVYQMHIGNHLLEGKKKILTKPIAVIKTVQSEADPNTKDMIIVGVCKSKISFEKRPTPIIEVPKDRKMKSDEYNPFKLAGAQKD